MAEVEEALLGLRCLLGWFITCSGGSITQTFIICLLFSVFLLFAIWCLFIVLLGNHEALEMLPVDHAAVNLELAEGVIDLGALNFSPQVMREWRNISASICP